MPIGVWCFLHRLFVRWFDPIRCFCAVSIQFSHFKITVQFSTHKTVIHERCRGSPNYDAKVFIDRQKLPRNARWRKWPLLFYDMHSFFHRKGDSKTKVMLIAHTNVRFKTKNYFSLHRSDSLQIPAGAIPSIEPFGRNRERHSN